MKHDPLVLMYHGIDTVPPEHDPHNLFVTATAFRSQLETLQENGFRFISMQEYLNPTPSAHRQVLLTFDDGYLSTLRTAAGVLAEFDAPAVCFVSPGLMQQPPSAVPHEAFRLLDGAEVRELAQRNFTIGAHGWDHSCMQNAPSAQLQRDTVHTREALCERLGQRPQVFAYPFGSHDRASRDAVRAAGYEMAFATHCGAGEFAVPRVDINSTDTDRTFRLKLRPWYPAARRTLGAVPQVRRSAHRLIGTADRTAATDRGRA